MVVNTIIIFRIGYMCELTRTQTFLPPVTEHIIAELPGYNNNQLNKTQPDSCSSISVVEWHGFGTIHWINHFESVTKHA